VTGLLGKRVAINRYSRVGSIEGIGSSVRIGFMSLPDGK
jgi:hypothetical protein